MTLIFFSIRRSVVSPKSSVRKEIGHLIDLFLVLHANPTRIGPCCVTHGRGKPLPYNGLTGCGCQLGSGGAGFVDDGGADEVAPFGPGAVVVANLVDAEQIFQNKPGVGTALADAAVGDDFVIAGDAFGLVELFEIVIGLEGAVFVGGLCPRDVGGLGNVSGALGGFGHAWRGDDFACEFIHGANVNELAGLAA